MSKIKDNNDGGHVTGLGGEGMSDTDTCYFWSVTTTQCHHMEGGVCVCMSLLLIYYVHTVHLYITRYPYVCKCLTMP